MPSPSTRSAGFPRSAPQPPITRSLRRTFTIAAALLCCAAHLAAAAQPPAQAGTAPVFLEDYTWTELRDAVRNGSTTVLVPVGGTEQSGPALTLGKHNLRVRALAERIARALGHTVVAPVIAYVPEGGIEPPTSHMRFAGTLSVPTPVFEGLLEATARSLRAHGFRDIVLLGDHGGYQAELARVAARLDRAWSGQDTRVWNASAYYEASSQGAARILRAMGYRDDEIGTHAGLADTALQLAVAPQSVRSDVLASNQRWDAAVGVYGGDPRRATAELGQIGLDEIVRESVTAIREAVGAPVAARRR